MKLRILNYRVTAAHDLISTLNSFSESVSIRDFDAFVYDPTGLDSDSISAPAFERRQAEIRDLLQKKGGIVVCILRSAPAENRPGFGQYQLLYSAAAGIASTVQAYVRSGVGSQLRTVPSAHGASAGYFQVLKGNLHFVAHSRAKPISSNPKRGHDLRS